MSNRSLLYMMNRIGNSGDPCGIPAGVENASVVMPLNFMLVVLLLKNDPTHCVIFFGIHRFLMLCNRRLWCTLLNAPATSINTVEYIFPSFHAEYIFSSNNSMASSVVRPCRPPKWFFGNRSYVSHKYDIC